MRTLITLICTLFLAASLQASSSSGGGSSLGTFASGAASVIGCVGFLPIMCGATATPPSSIPVWKDPGALSGTPWFSLSQATYNVPFIEPHSGERVVFISDASHTPFAAGSSEQFTSYSGQWNISSDGSYICVNNAPSLSGNGVKCIPFNETTFQAGTPTALINFLPTSYTFDRTNPHLLYGLSLTNSTTCNAATKLQSYNIDTTTYTDIVDFCNPAVFPNIGAITNSTQWEVTTNITGTRFLLWFNGIQNNGSYFAIYDTTLGGLWCNVATGDCNAGAGWGFTPTTWTGAMPSGDRCTQTSGLCNANAGIHRCSMDADGNTVWCEIQTNGGFETIFNLVGLAGIWGTGSSPDLHCTGAPNASDCQNHHAFNAGQAFNGAGNNGSASNAIRAWRVRGNQTPDTAGYPPGYSDLANTMSPGTIPAGTASHDSCSGTLNWPCADGGYYSQGQSNLAVTFPWQQELEIVAVTPNSQNVWRLIQHHMKSGYGSITTNGGVVGNGTTVSVTTQGPHSFNATQASVRAYNCADPSFNSTSITLATAPTATTFTYSAATIGTTDCEYVLNTSATDFYATTLVQLSGDGKYLCTIDNWERSFAADTQRSGSACNTHTCPQLHILCVETR